MIKDTPLFCYNYAHVVVFQCLSCTREFNHVFIQACVCVCAPYITIQWNACIDSIPHFLLLLFVLLKAFELGQAALHIWALLHQGFSCTDNEKIVTKKKSNKCEQSKSQILSRKLSGEGVNMYWMYWSYLSPCDVLSHHRNQVLWLVASLLVASCALERENGHPGWKASPRRVFKTQSRLPDCPE